MLALIRIHSGFLPIAISARFCFLLFRPIITGIKMAKVNDLSVTAGTQLKYKVEFANQASGSKEARIRGVSLQY